MAGLKQAARLIRGAGTIAIAGHMHPAPHNVDLTVTVDCSAGEVRE